MNPPANDFRIVTEWRLQGGIADIAAILTDVKAFPRWWGAVYLAVRILDPGDENQIGSTVAAHSKGWLPYRLDWVGRLVSADLPHRWEIDATGDLVGHGVWRLTQDGTMARVIYDWRVRAEKPLLRRLSPVLAPIFAWNHRWAMARGLEGLRGELTRRAQLPSAMPTTNKTA